MAREPKSDTKPTLDVEASNNGSPFYNPATQRGTKVGESNNTTEISTNDGVPVLGVPPLVDTSVLAQQDPKGDHRAGVIPDTFSPEIDPASNLPKSRMDGRTPIPAQTVAGTAAASVDALNKSKRKGSGVLVRLKADYWPMPDNYPEGWERDVNHPNHREYRLPAGTEVHLPSEEAMDLLERGQAERVRP